MLSARQGPGNSWCGISCGADGFSLATAVFFDAFVVRMAIVPAILALLGHRAWSLPRRLDRILPNVDGARDLREQLDETPGGEVGGQRELARV